MHFDPTKEIALIWHIDDVKHVRPDLTDEQAFEVLRQVEKHHDCEWGVSWQTIEDTADELFSPNQDKDDDDEEDDQ